MVYVFSHSQEREFYTMMILAVRITFSDLIKIGELVEEGIQVDTINTKLHN